MTRKIPTFPKEWKKKMSRTPKQISDAVKKVKEGNEWDKLHNEYIKAKTKLMYWDWLKENYLPPEKIK